MSRDEAVILDVLKAARLARRFLGDLDREALQRDVKTQSAILHQLLVVGEAVKRLSDGFRQRNPDIPWKQIAGMRDVLIHQYNDVDLDEVWKTLTVDIPRLIAFLEPLTPAPPERPDREG